MKGVQWARIRYVSNKLRLLTPRVIPALFVGDDDDDSIDDGASNRICRLLLSRKCDSQVLTVTMNKKEMEENPYRARPPEKRPEEHIHFRDAFKSQYPNGLGIVTNEKYLALCGKKSSPQTPESSRKTIDAKYFRLEASASEKNDEFSHLADLSVTLTPGRCF